MLGTLITPVDDAPDSRLEQLIQRGMPVVLVDRRSRQPGQCSVSVDDALGGNSPAPTWSSRATAGWRS